MLQVHKVCRPECVCWHIWEWACSISKLCRVTWPTIIPWEVIVYWKSMDQEQNTKTNILMHRLVHVDVIQMKSHFLWCLIRWGIYTLDSTYIQALTPGPFTPDHTQSKWIMVVCSMAKQLLHNLASTHRQSATKSFVMSQQVTSCDGLVYLWQVNP